MKPLGSRDRSQIATFSASNDFSSRLSSAFALATDWSAAMSGHSRLHDVVETMGHIAGAIHLSIYRMPKDGGEVRPIVAVDRRPAGTPGEAITGSLARHLISRSDAMLAPGAIYRLVELAETEDFAGTAADEEWAKRHDVDSATLVVLGNNDTECDFLEVLYDRVPDFSVDIPPALIAQALADAWSTRAPGLMLGLIAKFGIRKRLRPDLFETHILSPDNPFALSRVQQRVCQLLAAGQRPNDIAKLMGVSITTVRSHLSNIYSKTGTSGQVEVIALINGKGTDDSATDSTAA